MIVQNCILLQAKLPDITNRPGHLPCRIQHRPDIPLFPHDDLEAIARVPARLLWHEPHIAFEGPALPAEGLEVFTSAYPLLLGLDRRRKTENQEILQRRRVPDQSLLRMLE